MTYSRKFWTTIKTFKMVWIGLFYIVLTILMTLPLVFHMTDSIIGQIGDNIHFIWRLGWVPKALFELHTNPFDVWFLNYPEGWNMAYTEITAAQILIGLPFSLIGGPTFAYNMGMLISFILSALGMHLWVYRLTRSHWAGLIAGTAFAFLPYRMAHFLVGHYDLSGTQWLPLYFYAFFEILTPSRPDDIRAESALRGEGIPPKEPAKSLRKSPIHWKGILPGAIGLGLTGLSSQYYLYITLLISAFLLIVHLLSRPLPATAGITFGSKAVRRLRSFWDARLWLNLIAMGILALPLLTAAVAPFLRLNQQGGLPDRDLGIARQYSASPTDFLLPSTDHFLFGRWVGEHFNRDLWNESTLYLGMVCLALAVIAWVRRGKTNRHLLWLMVWGCAFAIVMAMGIDLHWNEKPVEILLPASLQSVFNRETAPILLPGYFFFRFFPFFAKLRALMRFGLFANLFICAAAGIGAAQILNHLQGKKMQSIVTVGLLALVIFDFYPGPYTQTAKIAPRPVDLWLAEQPGSGAVVQMPFVQSEDQEQTYYTLFHGKPFVGGFFNAFPPPQYIRIRQVLGKFPDYPSIELLKALGVQYVVVDTKSYPDSIRQEFESFKLTYRGLFDDQMVFEIVEEEYTQPRCFCD